MAWETSMVDEVCAVVNTTWTDLTYILLASELQVMNWENAVRQAIAASGTQQLPTPFAVVHLMPFQPAPELSGGDGEMYTCQAAIYYVTRRPAAPGIEATVRDKCELLRQALRLGTATYFMCHENPMIDATEGNAANRTFMSQGNHPLYAGCVVATLVCGLEGG